MDLSKWFVAMGIVTFISFFVAILGVITGENVVGLEIVIIYRAVNLFLIIIRLALEGIVVVISMLAIVISSIGLGLINLLLGTNLTAQVFYNMQTQFIVGIEGIYSELLGFIYDVSEINEMIFNIDIPFTPEDGFLAEIGNVGEDLTKIWNRSFGELIDRVGSWAGDVFPW